MSIRDTSKLADNWGENILQPEQVVCLALGGRVGAARVTTREVRTQQHLGGARLR
jgi:hypothetical protein